MRNKLTIITLSLSALAFGACANYGETPAAKGVFSLDVRMGSPVSASEGRRAKLCLFPGGV